MLVVGFLCLLQGASSLAVDSQLLRHHETARLGQEVESLRERVTFLEEEFMKMNSYGVEKDTHPEASRGAASTDISNELLLGALMNENFGLPSFEHKFMAIESSIDKSSIRTVLATAVFNVEFNFFQYYPIVYSSKTGMYNTNGNEMTSSELVREMLFCFQRGLSYDVPGMCSLNSHKDGFNEQQVEDLTNKFFDRLQQQITELTGTYPRWEMKDDGSAKFTFSPVIGGTRSK